LFLHLRTSYLPQCPPFKQPQLMFQNVSDHVSHPQSNKQNYI
jgi:hypothetical protein